MNLCVERHELVSRPTVSSRALLPVRDFQKRYITKGIHFIIFLLPHRERSYYTVNIAVSTSNYSTTAFPVTLPQGKEPVKFF